VKLFNTVIVFDVYCVAESADKAREMALIHVREGLPPSEQVGLEVTSDRSIREAWREEKPLVGSDVSDGDFAKLKGKTTIQTFEMLHKKPEPAKAK
jgi:hypothetical protein